MVKKYFDNATQFMGTGGEGPINLDNDLLKKVGDQALENIKNSKIDVSTGLPKMPTGGFGTVFDSIGSGIGGAVSGIKDYFSGDSDLRNAQAEYEAIQRGEQPPLSLKDKLIRETKRIGGQVENVVESGAKKIGGGLEALREEAAKNKALLNMGVQATAGYAGYQAGKQAREQVGGVLGQQLQEMQGVGSKFQGIDYDPQRYAEQQQFLRDRIAGGGYTAEERQMQQQGDVRGARASAAARLAGIEQMARLTGGTGSGAALASALTGGQAMGNIQAETEQARQASAQQKMESSIGQQAQILRQKTAEEADLAKQQADAALQRQREIGLVRGQQGQNIIDKATQEAGFYKTIADLGSSVIQGLETEDEKKQREAATKYEDDRRAAELDRVNAETEMFRNQDPNKAKELQDKLNAANKRISDMAAARAQTTGQPAQTAGQPAQRTDYVTLQPGDQGYAAANRSNAPTQATAPIQNVLTGAAQRVANTQPFTPIKQAVSTAANVFNQQNMTPRVPTTPIKATPAVPPKVTPAVPPKPTPTLAPKQTIVNPLTKKPLGR